METIQTGMLLDRIIDHHVPMHRSIYPSQTLCPFSNSCPPTDPCSHATDAVFPTPASLSVCGVRGNQTKPLVLSRSHADDTVVDESVRLRRCFGFQLPVTRSEKPTLVVIGGLLVTIVFSLPRQRLGW
jgi:hypothetical protein